MPATGTRRRDRRRCGRRVLDARAPAGFRGSAGAGEVGTGAGRACSADRRGAGGRRSARRPARGAAHPWPPLSPPVRAWSPRSTSACAWRPRRDLLFFVSSGPCRHRPRHHQAGSRTFARANFARAVQPSGVAQLVRRVGEVDGFSSRAMAFSSSRHSTDRRFGRLSPGDLGWPRRSAHRCYVGSQRRIHRHFRQPGYRAAKRQEHPASLPVASDCRRR